MSRILEGVAVSLVQIKNSKLLERMTISSRQRSRSVAMHLHDLGIAAQVRDPRVTRVCRTRSAPQQNDHEEKQDGIHKPL